MIYATRLNFLKQNKATVFTTDKLLSEGHYVIVEGKQYLVKDVTVQHTLIDNSLEHIFNSAYSLKSVQFVNLQATYKY